MGVEPAADELAVVVARHDDHLAIGPERAPERSQHRLGDGHRRARAALEELDRVAEEHEPVDAVERVEQRRQRAALAQDVAPETGAEVQVGDDEGAHETGAGP